jgi:hypothetical protein
MARPPHAALFLTESSSGKPAVLLEGGAMSAESLASGFFGTKGINWPKDGYLLRE